MPYEEPIAISYLNFAQSQVIASILTSRKVRLFAVFFNTLLSLHRYSNLPVAMNREAEMQQLIYLPIREKRNIPRCIRLLRVRDAEMSS